MQMNAYLSHKIKSLSFIGIVLVVFIHSTTTVFNFNSTVVNNAGFLNKFLQSLLSDGLARIAVPGFFCISGFLYFTNLEFSVDSFVKRFNSLILPYFFWSLYSLLFYFVLQQFQFSRSFFATRIIAHYSIAQIMYTILFDPLAYQLWFMRDLIFLILCSPFLYWLLKKIPVLTLNIACLLWILHARLFLFTGLSLLAFLVGGTLNFYSKQFPSEFKKNAVLVLCVCWCFSCIFRAYLLAVDGISLTTDILLDLGIIIGMISVWYLYDLMMNNENVPSAFWMKIFSNTFFLYAFHEPILTIVRKALFYFSDKSSASIFILYWFCPFVVILFSIWVAQVLQKTIPAFYGFITGGR